jgi:hypothetical protein
MLLKVGVITEGVQPPTWYALGIFEALYYKYGYELTVTSLVDGVHPDAKNIHGRGFAADLRTNGVPAGVLLQIVGDARTLLYKLGFDIVVETDHTHVEYDPKPGRDEWLLKHA